MTIYIYGLKCPVAGVIRYVGKSSRPTVRHRAHIYSASRNEHHTARWIRKLLRLGLEPELIILQQVAENERWQDIERDFIASATQRGWQLTNSTAGGEGLDYIDEEAKKQWIAKLSASSKKIWDTPEGRQRASLRSLRAWADQELAERRKASMRTAWASPSLRAKHREVMAALAAREDWAKINEQRAESVKKSWANPHMRDAHLESINRENMSVSAKRRWADPETRKSIDASRASPEYRAKLSDAAKRRATPEYKAMMAEKTRAAWQSGRRK